jgi:hypothetical protein
MYLLLYLLNRRRVSVTLLSNDNTASYNTTGVGGVRSPQNTNSCATP